MKYKVRNKEINIAEEVLESYQKNLDVTREEAIQIYLEDEGYEVNEVVEELTKKAKENRITATIHGATDVDRKKKKTVVRKENPDKEMIIAAIAEMLGSIEGTSNIKVANVGKIVEFSLNGKNFKVDLIQRRKLKTK